MNKELFEEIVDDIVRINRGNKNALIVICHSNGEKTITSHQYLIMENNYVKITRTEDKMYQYILYKCISAVYSNDEYGML